MKTYNYHDLSCARDILTSPHLYPVHFHRWANKVLCFFNGLYKLVRLYNKRVKCWVLSLKAVWQDVRTSQKKTIKNIIDAYMRGLRKHPSREFRTDGGEYCRDSYPEKQAQKCRAYKSRMRMNYMSTANKLQII